MITELLKRGKDNAISSKELMIACNIKDKRQLFKQVERERSSGSLICSCSKGGYYLPANREELKAGYKRLLKQGIGTLRSAKAFRLALKEFEGQESLFENKEVQSI